MARAEGQLGERAQVRMDCARIPAVPHSTKALAATTSKSGWVASSRENSLTRVATRTGNSDLDAHLQNYAP